MRFLGDGENKDSQVEAFVESQPFPDTQKPVFLLRLSERDFKIFRVPYGPAQDCPSGCFYSQTYGVKYGDRMGWMPVGPDSLRRDDLDYFDVRAGDTYLFSQDLRKRLQKAANESEDGSWAPHIYYAFFEMLARDVDTPSGVLLEVAELLYEDYLPGVAQTIIENPVVQESRSILETLADLPSFNQSDAYREVRERASTLLTQLSD